MELIGYRRLRTFGQLLFETFPSILLQLRMLYVLNRDDDGSRLNVTYTSLYYSLGFAFLHTLMEGSILRLDSKACYLSLEEYAVICLNARLSWVPFTDILACVSKSSMLEMKSKFNYDNDYNSIKQNQEKLLKRRVLDFENIVSNFCGLKYKLDFEFGKDSWEILIKYINNMESFCPHFNSIEKNNSNDNNSDDTYGDTDIKKILTPLFATCVNNGGMWSDCGDMILSYNSMLDVLPHILEIKLGKQCCKNLDLFDLFMLFEVASNKVVIDCNDIDWQRLIIMTQIQYNNAPASIKDVLIRVVDYLIKMGHLVSLQQLLDASNNVAIQSIDDNEWSFSLLKQQILSNAKYNLLPLKMCYEQGIRFGMNCQESNKLYQLVYQLIRPVLHQKQSTLQKPQVTNTAYENGQRFYTAMLLLWYTQGTIKMHHCYECGENWIDSIVKCERAYTVNTDDAEYSSRSIYNNDNNIKPQIRRMLRLYLPRNVCMKMGKNDSKLIEIPLGGICSSLSSRLSQLVLNYLFSKAYQCSFAAATVDGITISSDCISSLCQELEKLVSNVGINLIFDKTGTYDDEKVENIAQVGKMFDRMLMDKQVLEVIGDAVTTKRERRQLRQETDDNKKIYTLQFNTFMTVRIQDLMYCSSLCFFFECSKIHNTQRISNI